MAKIEVVVKSEIMRLAKREIRSAVLPLRREVRRMGLKLSGLSKGITSLNRLAKELRLEEAKPKLEATPEEVKASRLTPQRIAGLRKKLGMSQKELGILTGASLGAVQAWEGGKFRPKADKKAALVALRKLGKREVKKLLAERAEVQRERKAERKPPRRGRREKGSRKQKGQSKKPTGKRNPRATKNMRRGR